MKYYPANHRDVIRFGRRLMATDKLNDFMCVATGEFRSPKKGEWYISGAIPEGYAALNDLSQEFSIGRLVKVKRETLVIITEVS